MRANRLLKEKRKAGIPIEGAGAAAQGFVDFLTHPNSVQVIYRPVLQAPIPERPEIGEVGTDRALWWQEQTRRCLEGWTAPDGKWFSCYEYFYLNFVKVYIQTKGRKRRLTSPLYSDSDHRVFNWLFSLDASEWRMAKDGIVTKGRRKHWSYITHCGVFLWDFVFDPDAHVAIGYDSKITRESGQQLFEAAYNSLHPFFKHDKLLTHKEGELSNGEAQYDADGVITGYTERNTILFRELDKNPGGLRGRNLKRALFDEFGKYRNGLACVTATEDALREGLDKHGSLLIGGTSDAINNESTDYKDLWNEAAIRGWSTLFISAGWVAPPYIDYFTGISDVEGAESEYRRERDALRDAGKILAFYSKMQENPLAPSECFNPPMRSRYPEDSIEEQVQFLRQWPEDNWIIRGKLEWHTDSLGNQLRVDFKEDAAGPWHFYRDGFPRRDLPGLDIIGVDSVYQDKIKENKDSSKCAMVIYRRKVNKDAFESDLVVAYYEDRPPREIFAAEIHKAQVFTNGRIMMERNDVFDVKFLQKKGVNDEFIWVGDQVGIRNDEKTIPQQEMLAFDWFERGRHKACYFERILTGFKNHRASNDDVDSALHLAFHGADILRDHPLKTDDKAGVFGMSVGRTVTISERVARRTGGQESGGTTMLDNLRHRRETMQRGRR